MDSKEIFAANLNAQMKRLGKERKDVCNDLGISYYTFSDWVNGKKYPRMNKIDMLANYFGISKSDLIEEQSDSYREDDPVAESLIEINMKRMRILRKIDLEEFAKELHISVEQLKAYESGRAEVPFEILEDLARYFGISTDEILGIHHDNSWLNVTKKWIEKIGGAPFTEEEMDKVIEYAGYILYLRDKEK